MDDEVRRGGTRRMSGCGYSVVRAPPLRWRLVAGDREQRRTKYGADELRLRARRQIVRKVCGEDAYKPRVYA